MSTVRKMTRILVPVDFSERSMHAFHYAEDLAIQTGAELLIVHAFDRPASLDRAGQAIPADPSIKQKVMKIKTELPVRRCLHAGPPGAVICWVAQQEECDVIIMGTHGRTGLTHLMYGSTAEYVVRHARCPVMTLRQWPENAPPLEEPKVLPLPPPSMM